MPTLQDILANAQGGDAMAEFNRVFGLTPAQTKNAVAALLPAISMGLKRSTQTPEGLGDLFGLAGHLPDLSAMYEDPDAAFSPKGVATGNAVLANMFGSPEASRAIAAQAQQLSGVGGSILKKLLPVIAGMILSGLMRGGSGQAAPAPQPAPRQGSPMPGGGGLFDILRQVFPQVAGGTASSEPVGQGQSPIPPIGDILESIGDGGRSPSGARKASERPFTGSTDGGAPFPGSQQMPGGDIFGQILKEFGKAVQDGRVGPGAVGPGEGNTTGGRSPSGSGQPQTPRGAAGGNIFGDILRDVLGGAMGQSQAPRQSGLMDPTGGAGSMVFGDMLEAGTKIAQAQADSFQKILDQFPSPPRR